MSWERFRVTPKSRLRLKGWDPGDSGGIASREAAEERLREGVERMSELQRLLYAHGRYSLLVIFQGMDGAGKDSAISHVMSGLNPQGCQVYSFKVPSPEELAHDFLWRTTRCLPERGRIGVFNRSYYEEVLVARVHPEVLEKQRLPRHLETGEIWRERFRSINAFERHLSKNGTVVLKFFLHVSKAEQRLRFLERLDNREKNWKFSAADVAERRYFKAYQGAYEEALSSTSTVEAPWYVIPANRKWFARLAVADILVDTLASLDLSYPKPTPEAMRALRSARKLLGRGGTGSRRRATPRGNPGAELRRGV